MKRKSSELIKRFQRLIELSLDLASTLDLRVLLTRLVRDAADLCDTQEASILLYDQVKRELYFVAATNLDPLVMQAVAVPVDSSIAGWIITNRQPLTLSDARADERLFKKVSALTNLETRSLLGVPLIHKDKVVGVLEAINKCSGEFTDEDKTILMALGAQAAVAIENARLFQQSDLIAELVHELRTPMASLNTAAYLLARPSLESEQRQRLVDTIRSETMRLSELTTTFLDLARLESGRAQFRPEACDLAKLLEDCLGVMQGKANERGITMIIEIDKEFPPLQIDHDKMKQVFLNLISNAIKYNSPDGKIVIKATQEGNEAWIGVSDTGPGIPAAAMSNLFQKFYRVPGSEKLASGTGLGLSICKRIVEIHNGKIEVESEVGVGTTFRVKVPFEKQG